MWSTHPYLDLERSAVWRAPSWSWASLDNRITLDRLPPPHAAQLVEILSCKATPRRITAPYGEIVSAELKIRGYLMDFSKNNRGDFEIVVNHMKNEYLLPGAPHNLQSNLEHYRTALNLPGSLRAPDSSSNSWTPPKSLALLVLFAQPVEKQDESKNVGHQVIKVKPGTAAQTIHSYQILTRFRDAINAHDRPEMEKLAGDEYVAFVARYGTEWPDIGPGFDLYREMIECFSKQVLAERKLAVALERQDRLELQLAVDEYNASMVEQPSFMGESDEVVETNDSSDGHEVKKNDKNDQNEKPDDFIGLRISPPLPDGNSEEDVLDLPAGLEFEDDTAWLSCLVLVKKDDGKFERISCVTELPVRGISDLKKFTRVVEIV